MFVPHLPATVCRTSFVPGTTMMAQHLSLCLLRTPLRLLLVSRPCSCFSVLAPPSPPPPPSSLLLLPHPSVMSSPLPLLSRRSASFSSPLPAAASSAASSSCAAVENLTDMQKLMRNFLKQTPMQRMPFLSDCSVRSCFLSLFFFPSIHSFIHFQTTLFWLRSPSPFLFRCLVCVVLPQ